MIKLNDNGALVAADLVDGSVNVAEIVVTEGAELALPKSKGGKENGYPFQTKADILGKIAESPEFARDCLLTLYVNQTEDEQDTSSTKYKNRRGFMSSHAVTGSALAVKILNEETLDSEEQDKVTAMASRYGRQLAAHFRALALSQNPELAEAGKVFGV